LKGALNYSVCTWKHKLKHYATDSN